MSGKALAAIGALGVAWWASHGSSHSNSAPSPVLQEPESASEDAESADLGDTDADTTGLKGAETYDAFDARRDDLDGSAGTYEGYGCTVDCGGHEAGYQWAQDRGVTDPSECGGKSWSFEEGCSAYAEEQSNEDDEVSPEDS